MHRFPSGVTHRAALSTEVFALNGITAGAKTARHGS